MTSKLISINTKMPKKINLKLSVVSAFLAVFIALVTIGVPVMASAGTKCGDASYNVTTSIDIGCQGKGNPIADATFGIIRFLSDGVGLIIIGSIVYAGIQYTMSRGDPQAVAAAKDRIRGAIIALIIFIFAYAILDYIVPGAVLK